jgi:hypothetical protein
MARRELATAIVSDTILTVVRRDVGDYALEIEYPNGDTLKYGSLDVRDVFTSMGDEVRLLLHKEGTFSEEEKHFLKIMDRLPESEEA